MKTSKIKDFGINEVSFNVSELNQTEMLNTKGGCYMGLIFWSLVIIAGACTGGGVGLIGAGIAGTFGCLGSH